MKKKLVKFAVVVASCFAMIFTTVAIPVVSDVTCIEAEASTWTDKKIKCTVKKSKGDAIIKWKKVKGAEFYSILMKVVKVDGEKTYMDWEEIDITYDETKYTDHIIESCEMLGYAGETHVVRYAVCAHKRGSGYTSIKPSEKIKITEKDW